MPVWRSKGLALRDIWLKHSASLSLSHSLLWPGPTLFSLVRARALDSACQEACLRATRYDKAKVRATGRHMALIMSEVCRVFISLIRLEPSQASTLSQRAAPEKKKQHEGFSLDSEPSHKALKKRKNNRKKKDR